MAVQKKGTENSKRLSLNSYNRAQERKKANIAAQDVATKANAVYRERGERTPYQERKRAAYLARIARKYGTDVSQTSNA